MFNQKKYLKIKNIILKISKNKKNISSNERIILESYANKIQMISMQLRKFNVQELLLMKRLSI